MPHVCGDEPNTQTSFLTLLPVCPTYVGMNRRLVDAVQQSHRMPHVCGDEPPAAYTPPTPVDVCPTYVGMNRR